MNKDITLVMTACDRPDMTTQALRTFFEMNPNVISKAILTEDSGKDQDYAEIKEILRKNVTDYTIFFNETNIGQIASIDQMYRLVDTPYIFHMEDDIEWYKPNFVQDSMTIFNNYDRLIGGPLFTVGGFRTDRPKQMWIKPHRLEDETLNLGGIDCKLIRNGKTLHDDPKGAINMGGFALTHGLRETSFCRMWGPYSMIPSKLKTQEWDIGVKYRDAGFRSIVPVGNGYCRIQPNTHDRSCYHNGYEWRVIDE